MKNNTKKYFKYAIGEIILVVIGILIALQINNWNEANKFDKQEIKLLKQVKNDIEANQNNIKNLIQNLKYKKEAIDTVLLSLKNKSFKPRTPIFISQLHQKTFFNNINSGYKRIGNSPNAIIKNDTILNMIIKLYEVDHENILKFQAMMHRQIDDKLYPLTNKYFEVAPNYKINFGDEINYQANFYKPIKFELIIESNNYNNTLQQLHVDYLNRLKHFNYVKKNINHLLDKINLEIADH